MLHLREGEDILKDVICLFKSLAGVPFAIFIVKTNIGPFESLGKLEVLCIQVALGRLKFVHQGTVRLQSLLNGRDRRNLFVLCLDKRQGFFSYGFILRGHSRNRITGKSNFFCGDYSLVFVCRTKPIEPIYVLTGKNGENTGEPLCFACVDVNQLRMREGTS